MHTWAAAYPFEGPASKCGRYVTPDEAAMERAYNLTGRQWEAWMDEAAGRATTSHPRG